MSRTIPQKLLYFIKNALQDLDDGFEYASELNRILNSDDCQTILSGKEIEAIRDYADEVKKVGEINHYTQIKVQEIEKEHFGSRGILGFLGVASEPHSKPQWPF